MRAKLHLCVVFLIFLRIGGFGAAELSEGYFSKAVSLKYPAKIGVLELKDTTDFEGRQKGLGEGISYRSDDIKADIYIYNLGMEELPEGCDSEMASMSFDQSAGEIRFLGKRGGYARLKQESPKSKIKYGEIEYLSEKFSYIESGNAKQSYIFLTCFKNNFIKVRLTYNKIPGTEMDLAGYPDLFMNEISKLMAEKEERQMTEGR